MKCISIILYIALFLFTGTFSAQAYTIDNNYIGANPGGSYPQWETADVIRLASKFRIHGMPWSSITPQPPAPSNSMKSLLGPVAAKAT